MVKQSEFFKEDCDHGLVKRIMLKKYVQAFIPKILNIRGLKAIITDGFAGRGRYKSYGPNQSGWALDIEKYGSPMIILIVALHYFNFKSSQKIQEEKKVDVYHRIVIKRLLKQGSKPDKPDKGSCPYKDFRLRLFFIEKNKEHYSTLRESVSQYVHAFLGQIDSDAKTSIATTISRETEEMSKGREKTVVRVSHVKYPIECTIIRGTFEEFEPEPPVVIPTTSRFVNTRRLTFLDPFGFTQTPMSKVERFLQDENSTVFMTFMCKYVDLNKDTNPKALEKLYGDDGVAIKSKIKKYAEEHTNDTTARRKYCSELYTEYMKTHTRVRFALAFEMRKGKQGYNKPNDKGEVCPDELIHHMLYFSHHREGLKEMKEAMNRCSQYNIKHVKGEFKMSDYKIEAENIPLYLGNDQNNWVVANEVFKKFQGKKVTLGEVDDFVLMDTPFVFRHGILKIMEEEYKPRLIKVRNDKVDTQELKGKQRRGTGTFSKKGIYKGSIWMLTFGKMDQFERYRNLDMIADQVFDEFHSRDSVPIEKVKRSVQKLLLCKANIICEAILKMLEDDERLKSVVDANGSTKTRKKGTYPTTWGKWRLTFRSQAKSSEPQAGATEPHASVMEPQAAAIEPQAAAMEQQAAAMEPQAAAMEPHTGAMEPQAGAIGLESVTQTLQRQSIRDSFE